MPQPITRITSGYEEGSILTPVDPRVLALTSLRLDEGFRTEHDAAGGHNDPRIPAAWGAWRWTGSAYELVAGAGVAPGVVIEGPGLVGVSLADGLVMDSSKGWAADVHPLLPAEPTWAAEAGDPAAPEKTDQKVGLRFWSSSGGPVHTSFFFAAYGTVSASPAGPAGSRPASTPQVLAIDDVCPAELYQRFVDQLNAAVDALAIAHAIDGSTVGVSRLPEIPIAVALLERTNVTLPPVVRFAHGFSGSLDWRVVSGIVKFRPQAQRWWGGRATVRWMRSDLAEETVGIVGRDDYDGRYGFVVCGGELTTGLGDIRSILIVIYGER